MILEDLVLQSNFFLMVNILHLKNYRGGLRRHPSFIKIIGNDSLDIIKHLKNVILK